MNKETLQKIKTIFLSLSIIFTAVLVLQTIVLKIKNEPFDAFFIIAIATMVVDSIYLLFCLYEYLKYSSNQVKQPAQNQTSNQTQSSNNQVKPKINPEPTQPLQAKTVVKPEVKNNLISNFESETPAEPKPAKTESRAIKIDNYDEIENILNSHPAPLSDADMKDIDEKLKNVQLSKLDFYKLIKMAENATSLSNDYQMSITKNYCMLLKRNGYLEAAHKIYKYLLHKEGVNEFFMKDWSKVFTCNRQIDDAYAILKIGQLAYKKGLDKADIPAENLMIMKLMGGNIPCECELHMKDIDNARLSNNIDSYIRQVGGDPNRKPTYTLD